jgi:peptidoglycan/LPS O-acetylase OafA/YrhL
VLDDRARSVRGWLGKFYFNRYLRLMLSYTAIVAIVCYLNPVLLYAPPDAAGVAFRFSSVTLLGIDLTAFYNVGAGPAQSAIPINQAWSLGVEIEFYIVAPLLVLCRTRTLLVLLVVALCARLLTTDLAHVQQRVFPLSAYFFLLGLLSHRLYRAFPGIGALGPIAFAAAASIAAFGGYMGAHSWSPMNAIGYTAVLALAMPAVFAMTRHWKFDRRLGELSYPLYLVHIGVGQFVSWARADLATFMLVSIAAALPFYFLIEWNMDTIRKRITRPGARVAFPQTAEPLRASWPPLSR